MPLCAERPGDLGCHAMVDRYILFRREERADRMAAWARQTRTAIRAAGAWPEDLEPWPDDDTGTTQLQFGTIHA